MLCQPVEELRARQEDALLRMRQYIEGAALSEELHRVEFGLFRLLLAFGLLLLQEVIARLSAKMEAKSVAVGGDTLPYHGRKTVRYLSIFGEFGIRRAYYWKEGHEGFFPLDARLNLPRRKYSYLLDQWLQRRVVAGPYEEAIKSLEEFLGFTVPKLSPEEVAREAGADFDDFMRAKAPFDSVTEGSVVGVEADGKGVRMIPSERPEGNEPTASGPRRQKGEKSGGLRRMATATADFSFHPGVRTPQEMLDLLMKTTSPEEKARRAAERLERRSQGEAEPRQALNVQVAATMAGKEKAFRDLAGRVQRRDPAGTRKIVALIDGDRSLEEELRRVFAEQGLVARLDAVVLDIMHGAEYVWEAGTALQGECGPQRVPWVRDHLLALLEGKVGRVVGGLRQTLAKRDLTASRQESLKKAITYFENHAHLMRYDEYLAKGYPIATGLIEGVCGSLVKDRADRSGSRWARVGIQAVLNERAALKNDDWDAFWNFHVAREHDRLYGSTVNQN